MIEIRQSRVYRGPNIWARTPVIHLVVDAGGPETRRSDAIPGFAERLTELIPSLAEHGCTLGRPGGFLQRLREGTALAHVLEHVTLEVQNLAGAGVTRSKTRATAEPGVYDVIHEYAQEEVGLGAGLLAQRLLNHLLAGHEPDFHFAHHLEQLIRLAESRADGPSTAAIIAAAERSGIPVLRLDPKRSLVQLGYGCYQQRIRATVTSRTSEVATSIAGNKELTNRLLRNTGIPVPEGGTARSVEDALALAERIGYPVVLKPIDGNHGRGVCLNLGGAQQVRDGFPIAASESRDGAIIVERHVCGTDYRVLVIDKQVVAVAECVPAHVIGDGVRTVRELIERTNQDSRRGVGHEKILTRIPIDAQTQQTLASQGLTLGDLAAPGRRVQLQSTGNLSTGGASIDRTDDIHPENAAIARQAAMVVGLDIAGIDFLLPDIARPARETGGAIVEVNAGPDFRMHTHPTEGHPRHVGRAVIEMLFPQGGSARVPIVAVTGTNGKTTTTRMIGHIMRAAGHQVGMTTTDGISIDGVQIVAGDMAGPGSAQMVLQNPAIDCAVLETARGGIIRAGLGFDRCDVAVVTNISSDHLGLGGVESLEDLARIKAIVPEAVFRDGASILNADNEWTVRMARIARGEIIYFSMDGENTVVRDHLREHGRAVVARQTFAGEMVMLLAGKEETNLLLASEIPATLDGRLRVNLANALAACAAAIAREVPLACICDALRSFSSDFAQTPGRFNLLDIDGRQVVMDYGHNVAALHGVADFVRRSNAPRSIGVITTPGDRRDEDVRAFAVLAGQIFDEIVIREDDNPRGRERGEIAACLEDALRDWGYPAARIHVVLDELAATHAAIDLAMPGDLVVALVDRVNLVWDSLLRRSRLGRLPSLHGHAAREPIPAVWLMPAMSQADAVEQVFPA